MNKKYREADIPFYTEIEILDILLKAQRALQDVTIMVRHAFPDLKYLELMMIEREDIFKKMVTGTSKILWELQEDKEKNPPFKSYSM
jgi:hypothetical protein